MSERPLRLIIITGLSGSGKSTAIRAFEDRGCFCIDNLPVTMIPGLVESFQKTDNESNLLVLGIDAREKRFLDDFGQISKQVRDAGHRIEILYLEARTEVLIRRFSETRRKHPLAGMDVRAALEREKELLAEFRLEATHLIDTSTMSVHDLKRQIYEQMEMDPDKETLSVTLLSFGYKYGVPLEADLMFDVRCLPNPYFVAELKTRTGLDDEVFDYVMKFEESEKMLESIQSFLEFSIPLFAREGKMYLTVAIGCTGGKHRSISFVRALKRFMDETMSGYTVMIRHRDLYN